MFIETIKYIITFLTIFFSISLFRLIINFFRALLSTPPKKVVLERRDLIYYGICFSFITTVIINYLS